MFTDLSWSHILILLAIALVVVGPQDLPKFLRKIGKGVGKMRRMADQFRTSFEEMSRQTELKELQEEIERLRKDHEIKVPTSQELPYEDSKPAPEMPPPQPILPEGATPAEHVQAHPGESKP